MGTRTIRLRLSCLILRLPYTFQNMPAKCIKERETSALSDGHNLTLLHIKFHAPCLTPSLQGSEVPLQGNPVHLWRNGAVHEAIIHEQAYLRVNDWWEVNYMAQNNKYPNTVPRGMPERTGAGGEWVPSIATQWVLFARKPPIQRWTEPLIHNDWVSATCVCAAQCRRL